MKAEWVSVPLGEIAELRGRIGWKGLTAKEYTEAGPLFLSVHSLNYGDYVDFRDAFHITQERYDESPEIMLKCDDILICKDGAGIGKLGIVREVDEPTTINSSLLLIRPNARVAPKYLYFCLLSPYFQQIVQSRLEGATTPHLYQRDIVTFPVFLPPLEEQQRIVAVLDEAFDGLTRARAHTEANLQNARELFESKRRSLLTSKADTWPTKTLNEVCIVERGSSPRPIKNYVTETDDGVHWVKIGDTKPGSKYVVTTKEKITKAGAERSRAVYKGDFILTNSMTYGRPYIMAIDGYIHDGWFALRLKDEIDTDFFFHLLSSTVVQDQFHALAAGSVVKNISGDLVKKTVLALPPHDLQMDLALELDSISNDIERIQSHYQSKLQSLDALRQSLLQKAFAGELT